MTASPRKLRYGRAVMAMALGLLMSLLVWASLSGLTIDSQAQTAPLSEALRADYAALDTPSDLLPVIIYLRQPADLSQARQLRSPLSRRAAMVNTLQTHAERTQSELRQALAKAEAQGHADTVRPLWIINAIAAHVDHATAESLAQRPEVAEIRLDEVVYLPPITGPSLPFTPNTALTRSLRATASDTQLQALSALTIEHTWGLERLNVPRVWQALGIDGSGVVVGILDSGVELFHPQLESRYRGYQGPNLPAQHTGNWFDALANGATYPVDSQMHGTHVAGTILGGEQVGVAPGAQWIAARAFDNRGAGFNSHIQQAMQWFLAPNGDPSLAPDVINNSWANSSAAAPDFLESFELLREAGILPVFAAGNNGPNQGSIGAPASYENALAVGAVDSEDLIAFFSGRGPSPWTAAFVPTIVAPGVNVLSTLPGGTYGSLSGTSMATPHVVGLLALLKQANPSLTYTQLIDVLKTTAQPLGEPSPNHSYGYGLVDAYAAVRSVSLAGVLQGRLSNRLTGEGIAGGTVRLQARLNTGDLGPVITTTTSVTGSYEIGLQAGTYFVQATAFGYQNQPPGPITVITATAITQNLSLMPFARGELRGTVRQAETLRPLTATVSLAGTPLSQQTTASEGEFRFSLPAGRYTLTVSSPGHRLASLPNLLIEANQSHLHNVSLITQPSVLLVDSGAWYNQSQRGYYAQALSDAGYTFDLLRVTDPGGSPPQLEQLAPYDIVLWSAPLDSPRSSQGSLALQGYLEQGGNLLVSGQDVVLYDGGGSSFATYLIDMLHTRFVADSSNVFTLTAPSGSLFEGLSLTLNGGDSADNQTRPDVLRVTRGQEAEIALNYGNGFGAASQVGTCLPYRGLVFGFGLEGVRGADTRADIIARSMDWFQSPLRESGLSLAPEQSSAIGLPGTVISHTVSLFNLAEFGPTDTIRLQVENSLWPSAVQSETISLAPCSEASFIIDTPIPATAPLDTLAVLTLTAQSERWPGVSQLITLTAKTPAPLLLVDDDRWYNYENLYIDILDDLGVGFDYWSVDNPLRQGSPPLSLLNSYPQILWFTGYDWFNPLRPEEEALLAEYLDGGGRLAFASQEYLYTSPQHKPSAFAKKYFGVARHSESLTSTTVSGVAGSVLGDQLPPTELDFPKNYRNWTDSLTPTITATTQLRNQHNRAAALNNQGVVSETGATWHTSFFAFGPETLPPEPRTHVLRQTLGWLSWLGTSSSVTRQSEAFTDEVISYTTTLRHNGPVDIESAFFTGTWPDYLQVEPASVQGGPGVRDNSVVWRGPLRRGQVLTFTYQVRVTDEAPVGVVGRHQAELGYDDHTVQFYRWAETAINPANWLSSTFTASPTQFAVGDTVTYTLSLSNRNPVSLPRITVTTHLPEHLYINPTSVGTGSLLGPGPGPLDLLGTLNFDAPARQLRWLTPFTAGESLALRFTALVTGIPHPFTYPLPITVADGFQRVAFTATAHVEPLSIYLPLVWK